MQELFSSPEFQPPKGISDLSDFRFLNPLSLRKLSFNPQRGLAISPTADQLDAYAVRTLFQPPKGISDLSDLEIQAQGTGDLMFQPPKGISDLSD
jgi:hypothetical protein